MTLQIPTYYGNLLKDKENPGREQHCQPKLGGKKKTNKKPNNNNKKNQKPQKQALKTGLSA